MTTLEELEKLQELVRLVEAEYTNHLTEGPNGYCADDESVSAGVTGDSPLTFGHIRRARAAINALPGLIESARRVEDLREALITADLKIRSFPGADESDVEFIRAALKGT
jgi:hypothetical protein